MLKIRLTRKGKKNNAFFRVVVAEHTAPIKGRFVEVLGFLNPHTKEKSLKVDRIKYWIEKGAQCSDTVHNLLVANDVVKGPKRAVRIKKKPVEPASPAGDEKKPAEETEAKSETKEAEPVETKEEKKKVEDAKPEPEKKEEQKNSEEGK